ncbi:hypothetical protein [Autumnicola psychrophila]|uniref:DUF3976 domain-containing protein n=1 Tax=Autumnicola psychrophila TaxID=3075592 RepID=A0ABU3DT62_9FLAO|nr:hypothetical protein [Zunongwangia sp. F225]MDT0686906.1 hypothetical protein [Zunongwangia sp. F225]
MFSTGQLIFAGFFVVAFVAAIIFSYRKDIALHRKYYKGSIYVLIGFLAFIGILFLIKLFMNR